MEPKPPRRISQAPSARNLKPRRVSAVRRWPPGCGRSPPPPPSLPAVPPLPHPLASCPSPPPLPITATTTHTAVHTLNAAAAATAVADHSALTPLSPSNAATAAADPPNSPPAANGDAVDNGLEPQIVKMPNGDHVAEAEAEAEADTHGNKDDNKEDKVDTVPFTIKRWMGSKVYPPPKRRSVSAVRHYPPGCGRAPDFSLGLVRTSPPQIDHPDFNEGENHDNNDDNKYSQNDGVDRNEDQNRNQVVDQDQDENENDEMAPETGMPVEINEDRNVQSATDDDSESKIQKLPDDKRDNSMENCQIAEAIPGDDGVTRKEPECEVVSMDEEPLVNDAAAEPDIGERAAIKQPESEGLRGKMKKIKEKKKKTSKVSDIKKPKSEQDKMVDVGLRQTPVKPKTLVDSQPSKEIVIFSESVPQKDKNVSSKGKEKVVLKKKVVAKKKVTPGLGRKHDDGTISSYEDTTVVPFQMCNAEDATTSCINEEIILSQIRPHVCAKGLVAGPSQPSLTEGTPKKKGRKVAKKSTRHANDDSPSAQEPDLVTLTLPPVTPSDGERLSSARSRVKKVLRLFQVVCRMLIRNEESGSGKQPQKDETASQSKSKGPNRIDLKAVNLVKKSEEYVDPGDPVVGHLPGVEVGDEFRYRVELHLIGLHRPLQSGIDWTKVNGVPVATSIVASGGYSDGMDGSDVLNYTGAGGKPTGKKGSKPEDQKLERGNLALKNSMDMKTPVRVIHGLNTSDSSKKVMTFTYDGLYMVEEVKSETEMYKFEGQEYEVKVFRFRLRRMPGQAELGLHVATKSKRSIDREGLCVPDISQGMEKIPICAINTIDDEKPPAFKYITNMIYPSWYEKTAPKGCECTSKCSSSKRCLCALKNGGEIPFNFSGAIVQAKQLIYECGPSCRCPSSCHNRVSQHGIKIPLEIFKTESRGWGVRSLSSIPSGSFVCEYVGELLRDEVAERRDNDEYLFDIGHNYDDADLWKGLPSLVPGIGSTGDSGASASEGLTIDAAEMGNVGRFINHCCSPNLYAQNVLFDHDDRRMPHIMFFAAENIPPLQELTYHYNYDIGQVRDSQGNVKSKKCYCGSLECEGWLY